MGFTKTTYDVTLKLTQPMLGTIAASKSIFADHIASKMKKDLKKEGLTDEEIDEEIAKTISAVPEDDLDKLGLTTFFRTDSFNESGLWRKPEFDGYFLREYQVKGFFKEAARTLKEHGKTKQLKDKVGRYLFVEPWAIKLCDLQELPVVERPLRAQTAQGERIAIARSSAIPAGSEISFNIVTMSDVISETIIREILSYGKYLGMMQNRGNGYGAFEVVKFEEVE